MRLTDPTRIGAALADVRTMLGITRRQVARAIAEKTGRTETSVNAQLWTWEVPPGESSLGRRPDLASLAPYLDVIEFDLALVPRLENPGHLRTLLGIVDNALRNGSDMNKANLAFEHLCDELGVTRDELEHHPDWPRKEETAP